jgi:predicted small secreted protein
MTGIIRRGDISRHRQLQVFPMKTMIAICALAILAGCATVEGVGRDISGASRGVQGWF